MYPIYAKPSTEWYEFDGENKGKVHHNGLINLSKVTTIKKTSKVYYQGVEANGLNAISFDSKSWVFNTIEERDAEYKRISNIVLAVVPAVLKPITEARNL